MRMSQCVPTLLSDFYLVTSPNTPLIFNSIDYLIISEILIEVSETLI